MKRRRGPRRAARVDVTPHIDWARRVGRRVAAPLPRFDVEEADAVAMLALVEAASRWRPDGGAAFRTLAWVRIRGAIVDAHRSRWGGKAHPIGARQELPSGGADLCSVPANQETAAHVRGSLARLAAASPQLAEVALRRLAGQDYPAIGAALGGVDKSWACRLGQRALAALGAAA